jgi:hypothetical protein
MRAIRSVLATAFLVVVAAACGPTASPSIAPSPTSPAVQSAASPAVAAASPSAVAAERVDGTVQSLVGGTVTLASGRSVSVPASARVTRSTKITAADLHQGDYVAITAKRQPDNTLLASIVNVFPVSVGQVGAGQRPLPEGNLMTNASIDQLQGNAFTVTFPGGGARVQLAPDATITRQVDSSLDDVHQGDSVIMQVVDNTARTVTITTGTARS